VKFAADLERLGRALPRIVFKFYLDYAPNRIFTQLGSVSKTVEIEKDVKPD
jgi:hypothetical protein